MGQINDRMFRQLVGLYKIFSKAVRFRVIAIGLFAVMCAWLPRTAEAEINVTVTGPGGVTGQSLPDAGGAFDLNLPLTPNSVNLITVTAKDDFGNEASRELEVTQVSLNQVVVSRITSERLSVEEVEQLVVDGVIDLEDPENYNVSTFDILLTIDKRPVPVSIPVAVHKNELDPIGFETYKMPAGGNDSSGQPKPRPVQVVVFEQHVSPSAPGDPTPPPIPGVIIIEGNIKSLKEFFNVRLLLMNTSGIFTLSDVMAEIELPEDMLSNVLPVNGINSFGDILPGENGEPGQKEQEFIIRGDSIGIHDVKVSFGGTVTGPGITDPIAFNGSAVTEVEVKGPPAFLVEVTHPDSVTGGVPYELSVDITNTGQLTAMYASLELGIGADALVEICQLDSNGSPECEFTTGPEVRPFGHIEPGDTVRETFTVLPSASGSISSCVAATDQNITLNVYMGAKGCMVGQYPPESKTADGIPTVSVVPAPNTADISEESAVTAIFSERMNNGTIVTGENGTFNVFDSAGEIVPGIIRYESLYQGTDREKTIVIWQVDDGINNRLASRAEYSVVLTTGITDIQGNNLANRWESSFTTTDSGINDTTAPTISLSVAPPVNPNAVLPGEIIRVNAYAADAGSGISRVELLIKELGVDGALFTLIGQKTVFNGDLPPFIFTIDSGTLTAGATYQVRAVAYDAMGNAQDSTLAFLLLGNADPPAIDLPEDLADEILQGVSITLKPGLSAGVRRVEYFLDNNATAYKTVNLAPFQASLSTLNLSPGAHYITVKATDGLGQQNEAVYAFEIKENLNAPAVGFSGISDGAVFTAGETILIKGTAEDPAGIRTISYYLDSTSGDPVYTGFAPILLDSDGLAAGGHTIIIRAVNMLGIASDPNDPGAVFEFSIVEPPPGEPPAAPTLTSISYPVDGIVSVSGSSVSNARVVITNSDTGISTTAYADGSGNFTARIPGLAGHNLAVAAYDLSSSPDPGIEATAVVPSVPVLSYISASPENMTFTAAGASNNINVTGHYQDGSTADLTGQATFSSTASSIVTVSSTGTVVGVSYGTAEINISVNGQTTQVTVNCNIVTLTGISVSPSTLTLVATGQASIIGVTGHYSDGSNPVITAGVSYIVGDPAIASVNSAGVVTALSSGSTQVHVSYPGAAPVTVPVTVNTSLDPAPEISILSPSSGAPVQRNEDVNITVKAQDSIGGVNRIYLEATGAAVYSDTIQIAPADLSVTTAFHLKIDENAAIGGIVNITVTAEDTSGGLSAPAVIELVVGDTTAPQVTIAQPGQQTPYNYGDTVTVVVDAYDIGGISQIHFDANGALTASDDRFFQSPTSAQGEFTLLIPYNLSRPDVLLSAYAVDSQGNEGDAIPVNISITDADITPPETHITAVSEPGSGTYATVSYEVTSGIDDLDYVLLYFRKDGIGTFNRFTDAQGGNATGRFVPGGTTGTIIFDTTQMGGDGTYEFYTAGVDLAGNREAAPDDGSGNLLPDSGGTFGAGTAWTVINSSISISDGEDTYDNRNLRITGPGVVVTMKGSHTFHNMEILNGATLTHPDTTLDEEPSLNIDAWTITIDGTGAIDADEKGYLGGYRGGNDCTGQTIGNTDGSERRSGGSYGGLGGDYQGIPNPVYGNLVTPQESGSGGGCYDSGRPGGDGGGRIMIRAVNVISDGTISADGGTGHSYQAGSGSGGAVYMVVSTLSGTGSISTDGGANEVGGGGGRVAVHYLDLSTFNTALISSLGGQGSYSDGGNGTVFLKDVTGSNGTLVVDGQGIASAYSTLPIPAGYIFDNIILRNNARVVADDTLVVNDTLQVLSGSILTHTLSSEDGLTIEAARVEVDESSSIDVTSKGYRGGYRDGNSACKGLTLGGIPGSSFRAGGSYGGLGGDFSGSGINPAYGHPDNPVYLGSGGACFDSGRSGGNGGGRITITASRGIEINGSILANGGAGHSYQAGSGSGGSIMIKTSQLKGSGTITANGGDNETGGGGGRIAVTYDYIDTSGDDFNGLLNITALGGRGSHVRGSAGTVLLKRSDQTYGNLYIDDNISGSTSTVYTPLTHIGFGISTDLTADTLTTDGLVDLIPDGLAGLEINPNTNQGDGFIVLSNTENTVTVDISGGTALTDVASTGDTYVGIYRFDNIIFRRGGFMVIGDQIKVSDRILIDEYGALTHYDASLDFISYLEITADALEITDTGSINLDGRGYLGGRRNGNDCSGQTEGNVDGSGFRSGGSFGGPGGTYSSALPGDTYGSLTNPMDLGSGGGCYDSSRPGGDGGGYVKIIANDMEIDGVISANGNNGHSYQAGSGSGGTINITTGTLSGTGTIRANGGANEVGGGGGRIAVNYNSLSFDESHFQVLGGNGSYSDGGNGSLFLKDSTQNSGTLIIDGLGTVTGGGPSPVPGGYIFDDIILRNNALAVSDEGLTLKGTLKLLTGSTLTHTLGSENGLTIDAVRVEVDQTSAIDVNGKGYRGGYRDGNTNRAGLTLGESPGSVFRSGGSYGGSGGDYSGSGINPAYGHPANAVYLGSGGAAYDSSRPGGNGGGRITITTSEAVDIDGIVSAEGRTGHSYQAGSGSGGSIKIRTGLLSGRGIISADGGANEVGGGGGRVAIFYDILDNPGDDFDGLSNITAFGGSGSYVKGSAGTVFMKQTGQTNGDLYIDANSDTATASVYTPLTHIGFGNIMGLTADTITTDGTVDMMPNGLAGLVINPNVDQDETFTIISNTADTITVDVSGSKSLLDAASDGDTYAGIYNFDNVYFRRGGFLAIGDILSVNDTLLIDEYGTLTHFDAAMDFESRLVLNADILEISDTGAINVNGRGYLGGYRNGNDCTGQTVGNTDGSERRSGGSYGGLGAVYGGTPNPVYGSSSEPADLGSGGGCYDSGRPGGDGGGWVKISSNVMIIDGIISANGNNGHSYQAGSV